MSIVNVNSPQVFRLQVISLKSYDLRLKSKRLITLYEAASEEQAALAKRRMRLRSRNFLFASHRENVVKRKLSCFRRMSIQKKNDSRYFRYCPMNVARVFSFLKQKFFNYSKSRKVIRSYNPRNRWIFVVTIQISHHLRLVINLSPDSFPLPPW